jgi:hypothetical protein
MATLQNVEAAIQAQIENVICNIVVDDVPVTITTGIGWPSVKVLQNNVKGSNAIISIYDRKMARNSTRWKPTVLGQSVTNATLTTAVSQSTIPPGETAVITLGGEVTPGDAVSAVVTGNQFLSQQASDGQVLTTAAAQIAIGSASDTPITLAGTLASAINADPVLSQWVFASVSGSTITIRSLLPVGTLNLQSYTGNGGSMTREIGRRDRNFQVVIWAPTSNIRSAVTTALEALFQQIETDLWLTFSDGTMGRLFNQNDFDLEDATLADTYRHDFLFSVDYPITEQDALYAVLAPIAQWQVN